MADIIQNVKDSIQQLEAYRDRGISGAIHSLEVSREFLGFLEKRRDYEARAVLQGMKPRTVASIVEHAQCWITETSAYSHWREVNREKDKKLLDEAMMMLRMVSLIVDGLMVKDFFSLDDNPKEGG